MFGVGLALREIQKRISNIKYVSDCRTERQKTKVSVYALYTSKSKEEINMSYEDLQTVLDSIKSHDEIIILGGIKRQNKSKRRYNEEANNESGEQLT